MHKINFSEVGARSQRWQSRKLAPPLGRRRHMRILVWTAVAFLIAIFVLIALGKLAI
jgi:hypothetical protein